MSIHGFMDQNGQIQKYDYNDLENKPTIPAEVLIDDTLTEQGQAADAKAVGDALENVSIPIDDAISDVSTNPVQNRVIYQALQNSGLSQAVKTALLAIFQHVAYIDEYGQDYYDDLEEALNGGQSYTIICNLTGCTSSNTSIRIFEGQTYTATITASSGYTLDGAIATATMGGQTVTGFYNNGTISIPNVTGNLVITVTASSSVASISAVFTQGQNVVYTNDSLDSLRQYLTVTATYSDSTTDVVTDYILYGTLGEGTRTITVSYGGKTDTFTVACTVNGWLYHFDGNVLSSGSEDFNFTGPTDYATGVNGQAYYKNIALNEGVAIYAVDLSRIPDMTNGGTISFWYKTGTAKMGWMFSAQKTVSTSTSNYPQIGGLANIKSGWSVSNANVSKKFSGSRIGWEYSVINVRIFNKAGTYATNFKITPPSSFDSTEWHHFALTKSTDYDRFFIDGQLIFTFNNSIPGFSNLFTIGGLFKETVAEATTINTISTVDGYFDDFYIAEYCKWTSDFDPQTIVY